MMCHILGYICLFFFFNPITSKMRGEYKHITIEHIDLDDSSFEGMPFNEGSRENVFYTVSLGSKQRVV